MTPNKSKEGLAEAAVEKNELDADKCCDSCGNSARQDVVRVAIRRGFNQGYEAALAAEKEKVGKLLEALEYYANEENYGSDDSSRTTSNDCFDIVCFDFDRNHKPGKDYAGRRARAALAQYKGAGRDVGIVTIIPRMWIR